MDEKFSRFVRPLSGTLLVLILFQGASGSQLISGGADWSHAHSSYLLMLLALLMPVVAVKANLDDPSIKGNSFAVAGLAVMQMLVGLFMMKGDWSWGWLHIPLAMMMAAHAFAIIILSRRALAVE